MKVAFSFVLFFFIFWIFSWSLDPGKQSKTPVSGGQGITEVLLAILAAPLFVIGGIVYLLTRTIAETAPRIREHTREATQRARHALQRTREKSRNRREQSSEKNVQELVLQDPDESIDSRTSLRKRIWQRITQRRRTSDHKQRTRQQDDEDASMTRTASQRNEHASAQRFAAWRFSSRNHTQRPENRLVFFRQRRRNRRESEQVEDISSPPQRKRVHWLKRAIDVYLRHATVYTADLEPQDAASHLPAQNAEPSDIMRTLRAIGWSIRNKMQQP